MSHSPRNSKSPLRYRPHQPLHNKTRSSIKPQRSIWTNQQKRVMPMMTSRCGEQTVFVVETFRMPRKYVVVHRAAPQAHAVLEEAPQGGGMSDEEEDDTFDPAVLTAAQLTRTSDDAVESHRRSFKHA
jgi:hypothetical protein